MEQNPSEKVLVLKVLSDSDEWGETNYEKVRGKTEQGTSVSYSVHNLYECPEDATIERDLVSAGEFVEILRLGMQIAKEGYTDIECVDMNEEE